MSNYQIYCESEQLPSVMNMASIEGLLDMEYKVLSKGNKKRQIVSCHEYYCYKIQIRQKRTKKNITFLKIIPTMYS